MSQASIILNVSTESQSHSNGLSGVFTVPGKKPNEDFGILVIYPTPEIQDIGDQRKTIHWLKSSPIARDIVGVYRDKETGQRIVRSDATAHTPGSSGGKEKWGLMICDAEPDVPKEILQAQEQEMEYLNDNLPDTKYRKDKASGAMCLVNVEPVEVTEKKQALSNKVKKLKADFERECRKMVQRSEIDRAKAALVTECQRLVAEGDTIWAGPEAGRGNINEIHKRACGTLGQERPWAYVARPQQSCPGCGGYIAENVITCKLCGAIFEEAMESYPKMNPKDRARSLYPERFADPVQTSGTPSSNRPRA